MELHLRAPIGRGISFFLCIIAFVFVRENSLRAQPGSANVLFADHPLPIRVGIEIGANYLTFQNATPVFFPTQSPYSPTEDTIHAWFPSGYKPGFGIHLGLSADIALSREWGLLAKFSYDERRGTWNATTTMAGLDSNGFPIAAPVTNNMSLVMRYVDIDILARYSIKALDWFYVAGGLSIGGMTSNNYTITQTLGGPQNISFVDQGTGNGTGVRQYTLTNSFGDLNSVFAEVKLLVGFPIRIGHRWTLNPEVTAALPFTQLMSSSLRTALQQEGVANAPNPLTFTGILALRYEL